MHPDSIRYYAYGLAAIAIVLFLFVLGALNTHAYEPLYAPSPTPACTEIRFYKILLNKIVDDQGFVKQQWWLFITRYYVDGKFHEVIGSSNYVNNDVGPQLTYDKERKLWVLKYNTYCISAPFAGEVTTSWDWEVAQRDYLEWFKKNFPEYQIPSLTPTPLPFIINL